MTIKRIKLLIDKYRVEIETTKNAISLQTVASKGKEECINTRRRMYLIREWEAEIKAYEKVITDLKAFLALEQIDKHNPFQ